MPPVYCITLSSISPLPIRASHQNRHLRQLPRTLVACLFLVLLPGIATSASPDKATPQHARLFKNLAAAQTETEGRSAEHAIWQYWFGLAPTPSDRASLDAGMERREAYDYEAAENHLDILVESAPLYAEGYNQRAFVRFLRENYSGALTDIEKTLELEPQHFGALSGMYHVLRIQNRHQAAMGALRQAVTIHPWIQERGALPRSLWPESFRQVHDPDLEI